MAPKSIIPALSVSSMGTGIPGTITRSFPSGRDHFFRISEGENLHMEITFSDHHPKSSVCLCTNINNQFGNWYELPFRYVDSRHFQLDVKCTRPGRYSFRVKYTIDGHKWLWDCVPFSYVMVDPSIHATIRTYTLVTLAAGTVKDWEKTISHVEDLNCNVLHLLPVTKMGKTEAPYAAKDLFSIDQAYHDPDSKENGITQFSNFVDVVAERGIHLCIDLVFNHVSDDSNIVKLCPEWIQADENEPDGFRRAGWQGETWHKWDNLVLLDYDHPNEKTRKDLWDYMCGYGLFWAEFAARTKGMIRLDNLHSSHHGFMRHVLAEIRKAYPDITIFAELFTDTAKSSDLVWTYGLDLMLATPWEHHFVPQLRAYLGEVHRRDAQTPHMLPITSHDSGTPAEEFGSVESTVPRYTVSTLMGCGATGLVQGVEYGLPTKIQLVGIKPPPDYNTGHDYTPLISKINQILVENYVFQTGGNITFIDDGHDAIIAAYRFDTSKKATEFVVLCNFDIFNKQEISIDLNRHMPETAVQSFVDILGGSILTPANGRLDVTMDPCSALVLKIIQ